ncbi:2-succinyl-6-hydroxy-2,4-cyclohexadiene-1-carboxylate synthase [soil metagenome]
MLLHAEVEGTGPRLVLVHGFTQTGRSWGPVADDLATDHEVVRIDAPGHGRSDRIMAGLRTGARLIADRGDRATYLGYSMGGRYCLHLALANPELVDALVLVSATAGIDDPTERAARAEQDLALADRIEAIGVDAFVDEWLAQPLFAALPPAAAGREARRDNTADGLAESLRQAGTGSQDPLWDRLDRLAMPVLVVAGEHDTKFTGLAARLVRAIGPNAELATITGAGHAPHLERPDTFLAVLRSWLNSGDRTTSAL